jgi:hypothetical protein
VRDHHHVTHRASALPLACSILLRPQAPLTFLIWQVPMMPLLPLMAPHLQPKLNAGTCGGAASRRRPTTLFFRGRHASEPAAQAVRARLWSLRSLHTQGSPGMLHGGSSTRSLRRALSVPEIYPRLLEVTPWLGSTLSSLAAAPSL